ncbi:MAG: hydantoinase/carbamoylase family amidase [Betaproteobacteria bacterium]|nr:hydantoinase/carbamoylase family amidase [Betaproteobacteria bacterium]
MREDARDAALRVNEERLWLRHAEMAKIGAIPGNGVNRAALSREDIAARKLLLSWAVQRSFTVSIDAIGNLFVRRAGSEANAAPVMTGSHMDSQPRGGRFDGIYGVLAGLEALEAMNEAGVTTRRPIEVVAWTNEEGGRFAPCTMGSMVFTGARPLADVLDVTDNEGIKLRDALAETLAATPLATKREFNSPVAGYIEAHIEQGPLLENAGKTVGVVTGIQGLRWFNIEVSGKTDHAGTTPLALRKDAMRPNSVASHVLFSVDVRHPDPQTIKRLGEAVEPLARKAAKHCDVKVTPTLRDDPCVFDADVTNAVEAAAKGLELTHMRLSSGASHDAMYMARVCPTGMIFVPCEKGVSHNEAENATSADLAAGARVLTAALVELANR